MTKIANMTSGVPSGEYQPIGWNAAADLARRHEEAKAGTVAPCQISISVPGALWLPDSVILAAPVVEVGTFFRFNEMVAFLGQTSPELATSERNQIALLSICHLAPWSVLASPTQLYAALCEKHPAVFKQVCETFTAAFGEQEKRLAELVRRELGLSAQKGTVA